GTVGISNITASASGNTVTYNGASSQSISGISEFYNLTIDNGGTATLNSNANVNNVLTINQGVLALDNTLTLVSNASGTASLAEIISGSVTGNLEMQRYLNITVSGFKDITSPIQNSTIADWMPDIYISGFTGSDQDNGWVSMYTFDENLDGSASAGWVEPSNATDVTTSKGHSTYMSAATYNLSVTGTPNQGDQVFNSSSAHPITFTNNSTYDGLNYIGNPFPCNIDWELVVPSDRVNVDDQIYIFDDTGGNWGAYDGASNESTLGVTNIIPSSQGFWIHATADPTLTIKESHKSLDQSQDFVKTVFYESSSVLKLKVTGDVNSFYDETVLIFDPNSSENANDLSDITRQLSYQPAAPSLFTTSLDDAALMFNSLPDYEPNLEIPLSVLVGPGMSGNYSIEASKIVNMPIDGDVFLEDLLTGTITNINDSNSYSFYVSDTTTAPRFLLKFIVTPTETKNNHAGSNNISLSPNPIRDVSILSFNNPDLLYATINIQNELGQVVINESVFGDHYSISKDALSSGIFWATVSVEGFEPQHITIVVD
ncbi:MAG: hypothetical protein HRT72_12920, partial [Flavobacteriales bacterium]|nr:hypothetical protein [Flavobacteriales bacterium]